MIAVWKSDERSVANFGWLKSRHSFSFGSHYDPAHMGYRTLRVINDDPVEGGAGFSKHGLRDMGILSDVLNGALEHRDSMGNGSVLRAGDVQRMTAGAGVRCSEFNGDKAEPVEFLPIWFEPARSGLKPGYEEGRFPLEDRVGELTLLASPNGRDGSLTLHLDVDIYGDIYGADPQAGDEVETAQHPGRGAWIQLARGSASVNGVDLAEGDVAIVEDDASIKISTEDKAEAVIFDLA